ncbi:MAG: hypothetical protein CMN04_10850 [Roseibacillus sp.]|nr:hypothetical protein [Roseibacillus sp.]
MNRRRAVREDLGAGAVILLILTALVIAGAGVFHAFTKNQQIKVARALQRIENRVSQHRLDITNLEVRLEEQLNPILLNDRLIQMSSDLRSIPLEAVKSIPRDPAPTAKRGSPVQQQSPARRLGATPSLVDLDSL